MEEYDDLILWNDVLFVIDFVSFGFIFLFIV